MCSLSLVQLFNNGTDNYGSIIHIGPRKKIFCLLIQLLLVWFFHTPTSGDFANVFKKNLKKVYQNIITGHQTTK